MRDWCAGTMLLVSMVIVAHLVKEDLPFWTSLAVTMIPASLTYGAVGLISRRD